jgi:hypothetical protein
MCAQPQGAWGGERAEGGGACHELGCRLAGRGWKGLRMLVQPFWGVLGAGVPACTRALWQIRDMSDLAHAKGAYTSGWHPVLGALRGGG